jgi:type II secretory pathway component PulM
MGMIEAFKSRWSELQPREQQILGYGAAILSLLVFYLLIIDPVLSGREDAEQRLRAAREAYSVAQRQASDLKAAAKGPGSTQSGPLLTAVESSAQQQGLRSALRRLQPSGDSQIQVSLEGASYSQLMQWLSRLHQQGVRAERVDIQLDRQTDLLGVQLLLAR